MLNEGKKFLLLGRVTQIGSHNADQAIGQSTHKVEYLNIMFRNHEANPAQGLWKMITCGHSETATNC